MYNFLSYPKSIHIYQDYFVLIFFCDMPRQLQSKRKKCRNQNTANILKKWFLFCAELIRIDIYEHVALWYILFPESPVV